MTRWLRSKPAADDRDETIAAQAVELGKTRAQLAQVEAKLTNANAWVASEQRARQRMEASHANLIAALRKAHAVAIGLAETERDKAQAQLTTVQNANVNALLEKLNDTIGQLDKANSDLDVVRGDNADLRTQLAGLEKDLGREREDGRAFRQKWARHLNACPTAEEIHEEDIAKARTR